MRGYRSNHWRNLGIFCCFHRRKSSLSRVEISETHCYSTLIISADQRCFSSVHFLKISDRRWFSVDSEWQSFFNRILSQIQFSLAVDVIITLSHFDDMIYMWQNRRCFRENQRCSTLKNWFAEEQKHLWTASIQRHSASDIYETALIAQCLGLGFLAKKILGYLRFLAKILAIVLGKVGKIFEDGGKKSRKNFGFLDKKVKNIQDLHCKIDRRV